MKAPLLQTQKSINLKSMFFEFNLVLLLWDEEAYQRGVHSFWIVMKNCLFE